MKRGATYGIVAVFIGCLALLTSVPAAQAVDHDGFSLTVNHKAIRSGQPLRVTVSAKVDCTWAINWNGQRRVARTRTATTTFTAPTVQKPTRHLLQARCFYSSAGTTRTGSGMTVAASPTDVQTVVVTVPPSWFSSLGVNVLPAGGAVSPPGTGGHHPHGGLPGTGGPQLWPLVVGLITALVGAALVVGASRRRPVPAEA